MVVGAAEPDAGVAVPVVPAGWGGAGLFWPTPRAAPAGGSPTQILSPGWMTLLSVRLFQRCRSASWALNLRAMELSVSPVCTLYSILSPATVTGAFSPFG